MKHMLHRRSMLFLMGCLAGAAPVLAAGDAATQAARPAAHEILVLGGTGQLGAEIVRRLVDAGDHVTVLVRADSDRKRLAGLAVDYVNGDLLDAASVAAALQARHYHAIVNAVRVETGDIHFYEKIMAPLVAQAKSTGVAQIIHHGAVGAGANAAKFTTLGWEKVPGLLDRLKDQGIGEELLRSSGVGYTIIRNSRLYPDGTASTGKAELTEDDTALTPMTRADLAIFTVRCIDNPVCVNRTFHVRDLSLAWPPAH
jgi:uncharacterized protein YbjT (DUF2867 family)